MDLQGVYVGKKVKVENIKSGKAKKDGIWQLFTFYDSFIDKETKEKRSTGKYTIYVTNPIKNLSNDDIVLIKSISRTVVTTNNKTGQKKAIYKVYCEIDYVKTEEKVESKTAEKDNPLQLEQKSASDFMVFDAQGEDDLPW